MGHANEHRKEGCGHHRCLAGHRCSADKGLSRPQLPVDPALLHEAGLRRRLTKHAGSPNARTREVDMKKATHLTSTSVALNRRRFSLGLPLLTAGAAAPQ